MLRRLSSLHPRWAAVRCCSTKPFAGTLDAAHLSLMTKTAECIDQIQSASDTSKKALPLVLEDIVNARNAALQEIRQAKDAAKKEVAAQVRELLRQALLGTIAAIVIMYFAFPVVAGTKGSKNSLAGGDGDEDDKEYLEVMKLMEKTFNEANRSQEKAKK